MVGVVVVVLGYCSLLIKLLLTFVVFYFLFIEKCIVCSIATGKRLTREEFKARGNRMQRAGQANAVPLGPFKNNNGYANKAMPLGSPAPFV